MDFLSVYREAVRKVINEHIDFAGRNSEFRFEPIFDDAAGRYALMMHGWQGRKRFHACIIHLDITDGKIWIQYDGTEYGVAGELLNAGIPKDKIVLAFKSPELRKYTEFAAA